MNVTLLKQDVYYALREAYVTLLNGNITVNGVNVPVLNGGLPQGSELKYYILVESRDSTSVNPKNALVTLTNIQLSIFAKADNLIGNEHEEIAAQVVNIIEPYNGFTVPINSNFKIIEQKIVFNNNLPFAVLDTTKFALERNIIIEHRISHVAREIY